MPRSLGLYAQYTRPRFAKSSNVCQCFSLVDWKRGNVNLGPKSSSWRTGLWIPHRTLSLRWHRQLQRCMCHHRRSRQRHFPRCHARRRQASLRQTPDRSLSGPYHQCHAVHYRIGRGQGPSRLLGLALRPRPTVTLATLSIRVPPRHGTALMQNLYIHPLTTFSPFVAPLKSMIPPPSLSAGSSASPL